MRLHPLVAVRACDARIRPARVAVGRCRVAGCFRGTAATAGPFHGRGNRSQGVSRRGGIGGAQRPNHRLPGLRPPGPRAQGSDAARCDLPHLFDEQTAGILGGAGVDGRGQAWAGRSVVALSAGIRRHPGGDRRQRGCAADPQGRKADHLAPPAHPHGGVRGRLRRRCAGRRLARSCGSTCCARPARLRRARGQAAAGRRSRYPLRLRRRQHRTAVAGGGGRLRTALRRLPAAAHLRAVADGRHRV